MKFYVFKKIGTKGDIPIEDVLRERADSKDKRTVRQFIEDYCKEYGLQLLSREDDKCYLVYSSSSGWCGGNEFHNRYANWRFYNEERR